MQRSGVRSPRRPPISLTFPVRHWFGGAVNADGTVLGILPTAGQAHSPIPAKRNIQYSFRFRRRRQFITVTPVFLFQNHGAIPRPLRRMPSDVGGPGNIRPQRQTDADRAPPPAARAATMLVVRFGRHVHYIPHRLRRLPALRKLRGRVERAETWR
jgi:hypothetical protein